MQKLLEHLVQAASALSSFLPLDFASWVGLHRSIPLGLGGAMVAIGVLACAFGGHPIAFRVLLAPIVAAAGYRLAPQLAPSLHLAPATAGALGAGLLAAVALAWPPAILSAALGLCGGVAGAAVAGRADYWVGFVVGFLLLGVVALAAQRLLSVVVSAAAGAAVLVLGTLSVLSYTSLGAADSPTFDAAATVGLALLAVYYQLRYGKTDRDRQIERLDRVKRQQLARDAKAREQRFRQYDRDATGS